VSQSDPRGYYAALNISPTADTSEIKLAYHFLRASHRDGQKIRNVGEIEKAWETLGDLKKRAEYDGTAARRSGLLTDAKGKSRLNSGVLLAAVSLSFVVVIAIIFGDQLKAPFVSYEAGDQIQWKATKRPLGVVVSFEEEHPFPEGATQAAYKLRSKSGSELWIPAADLHLNGERK